MTNPDRRRNRIVRDLASGILKDCASKLQSTKNNVHLDEDNYRITLSEIHDVRTHLDDVVQLLKDYQDDPTDTIIRLLGLES